MNYWVSPGLHRDPVKTIPDLVIQRVKFWYPNYEPSGDKMTKAGYKRNFGKTEVYGRLRYTPYVMSRQIIMWIFEKFTPMNTSAVASHFKKNHATVIHARRQVENLMEVDSSFEKLVRSILEEADKRQYFCTHSVPTVYPQCTHKS